MKQDKDCISKKPVYSGCPPYPNTELMQKRLEQCFGKKRKVVVIHTGESIDEVVIKLKDGRDAHE